MNACRKMSLVIGLMAFLFVTNELTSQCQTAPGQIKGQIFLDKNYNGQIDGGEVGTAESSVFIYDQSGTLIVEAIPNTDGEFVVDGLTDGQVYRLNVSTPDYMSASFKGSDHSSDLRFVTSPACDMNFGVMAPADYCDSDNPNIAVTCFVKGGAGINDDMETVVFTPYLFNTRSAVQKVAMKGQTGSVFGTAWQSGSRTLYTSAFVKQDAQLIHGPGAIFTSDFNQLMPQTQLWLTLDQLGVNVGQLAIADADNCDYGAQVGKFGIGGIEISDDESKLLIVNLFEKSVVVVDILDPRPETTIEIPFPALNCNGGEMRPFAIKNYKGDYYVTATCDASISQNKADHKIAVFKLDYENKTFSNVFQTSYTRDYWLDDPSSNTKVGHWLTDLEFTPDGYMVLGIADRQSHRYCHASLNLINQFPDILMVWNDNGTWKLESNGTAGALTGSGVNNGQGPGGGEFFGEDYWILGPLYHPETATGSLFALPGSNEVACTVFDPVYSTFSGGFHRYNTRNGKKTGAVELYTNNTVQVFGKGSGLGNIIDMCEPAPIQIGNFVWLDDNKNGVQDANEAPVPDLELSLINDKCEVVGTTTTDVNGEYYFDEELYYNTHYTLVVSDARFAEVDGTLSIGGETYMITAADAASGIFSNDIDSDANISGDVGCDLINGKIAISITTSGPGFVNHTFDLGLSTEQVVITGPDTFDLALMKEVRTNRPVKLGEMVDFDITIFNQGTVGAKDIEIVEYMPAGFDFSGIFNPGWVFQNGLLSYTYMGELEPGESTTISIQLQVKKAANRADYINYAEIASAKTVNGSPAIDIDSTPDRIVDNDKGGEPETATDNEYEDDGTIDEDDHDPAMVKVFDLALIKTTAQSAPVVKGDKVVFDITVYNQGFVSVNEIGLIDYLPQGLALSADDTNGWIVDNGNLINTISGELAPGGVTSVQVVLEVTEKAVVGTLVNFAEITRAIDMNGTDISAYDIDSTPDETMDNDKGGEPEKATDNEYEDDGTVDEDDHDPAMLHIFDLALIKTVDKTNVDNTSEEVTFTFHLYNQGDVSSHVVTIADHLPDGFIFNPALNPAWDYRNANLLTLTYGGEIEGGTSMTFDLVLTLAPEALGKQLVNIGEISRALDANGKAIRDFDSVADNDKDNDAGGQVGGATDNITNGDGTLDEDDHDPAVVNGIAQMMVDVSLNKTVSQTHREAGSNVEFTFEVMNEESTTVGQIRIVDYLPFFLENVDPNWTLSASGLYVYRDLAPGNGIPVDGLQPGESVTTTMISKIREGVPPGPILNTAEIAFVSPFADQSVSAGDIDSQADDDPNNDRSDNPKEVAGGVGGSRPIEDDRGAAEVVVCKIERLDSCTCLNNETTNFDGQFQERIVVTSASGETWYVQEANNIFRATSPAPPAAPIPFDMDMLVETPLGGGISTYTLTIRFQEGMAWYAVVRNNFDAIHSIEGGQECRYSHPAIIGANSVCVSGLEVYEIIPATPGATYDWTLSGGGSFVGGTSGPRVMVQWDAAVGGPFRITANEISPDNCTAPSSLDVEVGDQFIYSMSCIQETQVSLGRNCESRVTAQMLLTGGPYDYSAFNVMLEDEHGHPIPDATLTYEHIGKTIIAKVINACTGNSCWSYIHVEDKVGPEIICFNDTVDCTSMGKYPLAVAIDGCDPNPTVQLLNESVQPIDCDPDFIKRVTRTYIAEDMWGNFSDTCTQEIMLRRINVDSILYPDTFSIATGNPLICNSFAADSLGRPLPEVTGVPMYGDVRLYPEEFYCSIGVDYHDTELQQIGCVRKMVREWRIVEWYCTTGFNLIRYPQYIEITDTVAPEIICPDVHYVKTNTSSCDADVFIEMPQIMDQCSDSFRVDLVYPGGFIEDYTARYITLPVDTNLLKFRVYDECYNVDSCVFEVIVEDNTPPLAICDQFTTVGLTDTGIAYIYAHTFDDGSYDNCALKKMEVKRMDDGANCGWVADTFGPYVEFCCEDAGTNVMVLFRVTDKSGNENTCMVEVEVQDKIPPMIYCPADDTINCEYHYDLTDLSEFGQPTVFDNCDYVLEERIFENVDQCREGYLERVFIARDSNNVSTCVQRIYIINETPFDSSNITWPLDLDTTECREGFLTPDLLPDPYGFPKVDEDACDLVGITFTDHTFPFVSNSEACYKIVRKWKIINWCRFDSSTYDQWIYEQVIKVSNEIAPTITSDCGDVEKCIFDDCEIGYIELFATATDDCTEDSELRWEYHVDLDDDGIVDLSNEGNGPRIDIQREFRLGEHSVRYVFEDRCGNKTVCTQYFDLVNCKGPTAYCKNGIVVDLIPMDLDGDGECDTEMVEIWARDLDDNSFHPCDYPLVYSIGRDTTIKSVTFDCRDLGRRELEICVTDSRGYQSCCNTFVIVQDNNDIDCCDVEFDKDCVVGPADVNLTDCMASTDPNDLMSFPMTTNCDVDSVVVTYMDEDGTNGDVCLKIKRTWTVELYLGNLDTVCTFVHCITIDNQFTEDSIVWPNDTLNLDDCVVNLDTSVTGGVPVLLGEYCDYVTIDYSDIPLEEPDPACESYMRTWTVVNACDNDKTFTFEQVIRYKNQAPPSLTIPGDITVSADPGTCNAEVTLPEVFATDCSRGVTIVNTFNNGGPDASGLYPVGTTVVTFMATDDCGNMSSGQTVVVVEDNVPPTITCPQDMVLDCDVDLDMVVFGDPITNDNCGVASLLRDTVYNLNACNIGTIMVTYTVMDNSGNAASCTQTITINNDDPFVEGDITWPMDTVVISVCDSSAPEFTGEPIIDTSAVSCFDITVTFVDTMHMDTCNGLPCTYIERMWTVTDSCQFDGMGGGIFTFLQVIEIDGQSLQIFCPGDTTILCEDGLGDLNEYGVFSFTSQCGVVSEVLDTLYNLNTCDVGTVTRTYTVQDSSGMVLSCSQTITIEIGMPFTEDRILWPADSVQVGTCDSIFMAGMPILDISGLTCHDLRVFSMDSMYVDTCENGPCDVLFRKWTVMDSCQLDGMGGGIFCDTQYIVFNGDVLSVTCPPDTTVNCDQPLDDLDRYGLLLFTSPCGIDTVIRDTVYELNACSLGTITRSILVRDTTGMELTCSQVITIEGDNPFGLEDITWPMDTVMIDNCVSLDPDSLMDGRPVIDSTALDCALVSVAFSDSTSSSCDQSPCAIVYRDWTVIDSCQLDGMGGGIFTFSQVIEVNDTVAPVFNVMSIDTVVYATADSCVGDLELVVMAMDCSPNVTITNNSPYADSTGADASGTYPPGITTFFFYAEDACCNIDSIPVTVELRDTFPPEVVCRKVFMTMEDSLIGVTYHIGEDHFQVLEDNCTDPPNFTWSFSLNDLSDTTRFYDCDTLLLKGLPNLLFTHTVYVWDEAGNLDSCTVLHQVVDHSGCTKPQINVYVAGLVSTDNNTLVRDVEVNLTGSGYQTAMTNDNGIYGFAPMLPGGTYDVRPFKDDNHLEGVSAKDLILIQRHLIGLDELDDAYDRIAADVNNNQDISAGDIVQLRRLLLGYYNQFPDNTSWRFVQYDYQFPDPKDPWFEPFPEDYHIQPLVSSMNVDFMGVKIGDVSGDYGGLKGSNGTRGKDLMVIEYEVKDGFYHFYRNSDVPVAGYQMTLGWIPGDEVSVEFLEHGDLTDEQLGYHSLDYGMMSVVQDQVVTQGRSYLFSLPESAITGSVTLNDAILKAEAYDMDLNEMDIVLRSSEEANSHYILYQNKPNPFRKSTIIGFELPKDQHARISVLNMNGQVVIERDGLFDEGYNEIEIRNDALFGSGIYYYRLDCEGYSKVMKMINID